MCPIPGNHARKRTVRLTFLSHFGFAEAYRRRPFVLSFCRLAAHFRESDTMGSVTRNMRLAMPYHVQELLFMQRGGYSKSTDTVRWGTIPDPAVLSSNAARSESLHIALSVLLL
jgi:hypothetical protein